MSRVGCLGWVDIVVKEWGLWIFEVDGDVEIVWVVVVMDGVRDKCCVMSVILEEGWLLNFMWGIIGSVFGRVVVGNFKCGVSLIVVLLVVLFCVGLMKFWWFWLWCWSSGCLGMGGGWWGKWCDFGFGECVLIGLDVVIDVVFVWWIL